MIALKRTLKEPELAPSGAEALADVPGISAILGFSKL